MKQAFILFWISPTPKNINIYIYIFIYCIYLQVLLYFTKMFSLDGSSAIQSFANLTAALSKKWRMHDPILRTFSLLLKYFNKGGKKQHSQHIKPKIVYTFYTEALFKMNLTSSPLQERLNKACFRQSLWCCSLERGENQRGPSRKFSRSCCHQFQEPKDIISSI